MFVCVCVRERESVCVCVFLSHEFFSAAAAVATRLCKRVGCTSAYTLASVSALLRLCEGAVKALLRLC